MEVVAGVQGPLSTVPKWKKCTREVQDHFGHVVGKWFANETLSGELVL